MACEQPLFTFGVFADMQYADIDDQWNATKTHFRHYRHSLEATKQTLALFAQQSPSFIVQLGDLIDLRAPDETSTKHLDMFLKHYDKVLPNTPLYHVIGNHEIVNFSKKEISSLFYKGGSSYYAFNAPNNALFRFIVLDGFAKNTIESLTKKDRKQGKRSKEAIKCDQWLQEKNPYTTKKDWCEGLNGVERRFVPYNGDIDDQQFEWFGKELENAKNQKQSVIIFSHIPVMPGSCVDSCLLWDYERVLNLLNKYSDQVICYLAGHDHQGGYYYDSLTNIHHKTFESTLEVPIGETAGAMFQVYQDRVEMKGIGVVESKTFQIKKK